MIGRVAVLWAIALTACDQKTPTSNDTTPTRTYRTGFSAIPPSANQALVLANLDRWGKRVRTPSPLTPLSARPSHPIHGPVLYLAD